MEIYVTWILALILTLILTIFFTVLFTKIKGNLFEDVRGGIPRAIGIAPFIAMVIFFPKPFSYLIGLMGILAFIDDLLGRKKIGSLPIDVGQLLRGIGIIAVMVLGYYCMGPIAILVALMVQIMNIADMQPGTVCTTVFIMSIISFAILTLLGSPLYYLPILLIFICLGYASQDYSGYIMMGEVGNHSFGIALGIILAIVSAVITKGITTTMFYPVEFIVMIILFLITTIIIAYLRKRTLKNYLEQYLNIQNPVFGDYVMDVLTGGGLGDLFRKIIFQNKQYRTNNDILILLGARRFLFNPFAQQYQEHKVFTQHKL
ncbi:MAG: cell wall biosynthesis protein [Methanobacteriaceae archaeon]|nr:cell wall biosynthesis protein [Methanobacteriaceae archaeon]